MDRTVDELALEIYRSSQQASVAEITHWLRTQHAITDPDFVRDVIIHYWHLQQDAEANRQD
jgi:hypothetical protein